MVGIAKPRFPSFGNEAPEPPEYSDPGLFRSRVVEDDLIDIDEVDEIRRYRSRQRSLVWLGLLVIASGLTLTYYELILPIQARLATTEAKSRTWEGRFDRAQAKAVELGSSLGRLEASHAILADGLAARDAKEKARVEKADKLLAAVTTKFAREITRGQIAARRDGDKVVIELIDGTLFVPGKTNVHAPGRAILWKISQVMRKMSPGHVVQVGAHTDSSGVSGRLAVRFPTNWEIASARAVSVARFLAERCKIPGHLVSAESFGPFRPVTSNSSRVGRHRNRRIELTIEAPPTS